VDSRHNVSPPSRPGLNGRERLGPTAYVAKGARTCLRETMYAEQSMKGWRFVVTYGGRFHARPPVHGRIRGSESGGLSGCGYLHVSTQPKYNTNQRQTAQGSREML
ncbi:unnamed protein product, partial [Ascophyllum nodosum]